MLVNYLNNLKYLSPILQSSLWQVNKINLEQLAIKNIYFLIINLELVRYLLRCNSILLETFKVDFEENNQIKPNLTIPYQSSF